MYIKKFIEIDTTLLEIVYFPEDINIKMKKVGDDYHYLNTETDDWEFINFTFKVNDILIFNKETYQITNTTILPFKLLTDDKVKQLISMDFDSTKLEFLIKKNNCTTKNLICIYKSEREV